MFILVNFQLGALISVCLFLTLLIASCELILYLLMIYSIHYMHTIIWNVYTYSIINISLCVIYSMIIIDTANNAHAPFVVSALRLAVEKRISPGPECHM